MASRRASVLSRKASNHSLRIPSSDAVAELEAADLHASRAGGGDASESQVDEPGTGGAELLDELSLHDRQATIVQRGQPSTAHLDDPAAHSTEGHSRMMISEETAAIPINSANGFATSFSQAALSQAATPMNDTFLSTLAPMPIHQRLDLADQIENNSSVGHGSGSGVPETLEEESDSLMEVEGEGDDRRRGSGTDEGVFELNGP